MLQDHKVRPQRATAKYFEVSEPSFSMESSKPGTCGKNLSEV